MSSLSIMSAFIVNYANVSIMSGVHDDGNDMSAVLSVRNAM